MSSRAADRRLRGAAASVGWFVGIAAACLTVAGGTVLLTLITLRSRHEVHEAETTGRFDGVVVDRDFVFVTVVVICVVGVIATAVVALIAARRAIAPLEQALRLQRSFVADASHELRTPLAVLSTRVQLLDRRLHRGQDTAGMVASLQHDVDSMGAVLNDLLLSAELDGAARDDEVTDAGAVAAEVVQSLDIMARTAHIVLRLDAVSDEKQNIVVPHASLTRAIVVLVDNAVEHSPDGALITLSVRSHGRRVEIRVADTGTGIPSGQQETLFDRFSHGLEGARRRGFGLGLALTKEIARRYHGDVGVESTSEQGTTMLLWFPGTVRRQQLPAGRAGEA